MSADVEGMFLQVGVLARDQISLRFFLWREDATSDVVVHQYTHHIFGARDSPTCANFAFRTTATDNMSTYPEAASVVNEKFYIDDYLDSFENVTHAIKISRDSVLLLKLGVFILTKFVSTADEITSAMIPEDSETSSSPIKEICTGAEQSSHVLGLKWDHVKDTLVVSRGVNRALDKAISQQTVLSFVSSVFEPVGLIAPYTVRARLLLKDIWKIRDQSWDDELPEDIRDKFLGWHSGLPLLGQLTIPRCYFTKPVAQIELHMFLDSSQDIFCAVGFLCARLSSSHKTQVSFIFGKARVAPKKALSIPEPELQAALLTTRLKDDILTALTVCVNHFYMWTDSTSNLQWLNSTEKLPVFVANRVCEILESTTFDEWHHVLSGDNPADTGTRWISSKALKDSSWAIGPSILRATDWPFIPKERVINKVCLKGSSCDVDNCLETSSSFVTDVTSIKHPEYGFNCERFRSFTRYKRVVAFKLRMLPSHKHFRGKDLRITDLTEIDIAECKLIHLAQMESFPVELKTLTAGKPNKNNDEIATYSPFIGPACIIRFTGRIVRSVNTEFDTKHPILLDARHTLNRLLARSLHHKQFHQGLDYMRSVLK